MSYQAKDRGSEQLVYSETASELPLRGPSGQLMTIPLGGNQQIQWAPTDRRAVDVELRVGIKALLLNGSSISFPDPIVRWQVETGHGMYVWTEPPSAMVPLNVPSVQRSFLPVRGLLKRISARELRFVGYFDGNFGIQRYSSVTLDVSFLPCKSMTLPVYPTEEVVDPSVGAGVVLVAKFPPSASEWRLFDVNGDPYVAAAHTDVELVGIGGGVSAPMDRANWADFKPIPPRTWGWTLSGLDASTSPVYAQYR